MNDKIIIGDSMKKYLKYILLLFLFFSFKNVYAVNLEVCSSDCQYQTLDQALSDIERYGEDGDSPVSIILVESGSYSISRDYQLDARVHIEVDSSGRYTIDGNNHTIYTTRFLRFSVDYLTLKNINIDYESNSQDPISIATAFISNKAVIDNVHIVHNGRITLNRSSVGMFMLTPSIDISNSDVSNFAMGVVSYLDVSMTNFTMRILDDSISNIFNNDIIGDSPISVMPFLFIPSIEIDSCDLSENVFSLQGLFNGNVSNSKISSAYLLGGSVDSGIVGSNMVFHDNNDYGDAKIVKMKAPSFSGPGENQSFLQEVMQKTLNKEAFYFITDDVSTIDISVKKNKDINIENTKKLSILDYFVDIDAVNIRDYAFTVSDPSIAKVENGEVIFLKSGEVDVIAINRSTNEKYTMHFRLEVPVKPSVNPKTVNSILFISFILLLLLIPLFVSIKSQKSSS